MIYDIDYIIAPELTGKTIVDVSVFCFIVWLIGQAVSDYLDSLKRKYKKYVFWVTVGMMI